MKPTNTASRYIVADHYTDGSLCHRSHSFRSGMQARDFADRTGLGNCVIELHGLIRHGVEYGTSAPVIVATIARGR